MGIEAESRNINSRGTLLGVSYAHASTAVWSTIKDDLGHRSDKWRSHRAWDQDRYV
jgi:hypothetical protein